MAATEPEIAPVWGEDVSASPDLIRPSDGYIGVGWPLTDIPPSRAFFNWILKFVANGVTYLLERGIPTWQNNGRGYAPGALVRDPYDGAIYMNVSGDTSSVGAPSDENGAGVVWRLLFDRLGFTRGHVIQWTEDWAATFFSPYITSQIGAGSSYIDATQKGWNATVTKASGGTASIRIKHPADSGVPSTKLSDVLEIAVGTSVGDKSQINKNTNQIFSPDNAVALDFDVWPGAAAVADSQLYLGLGQLKPTTALIGGIFYSDGSANWKCVSGTGSALSTAVDTGVAIAGAGWQQMRVEWCGINKAADGVTGFRFYINGALVAMITTALPTNGYANIGFGAEKLAGSTSLAAFISPVKFRYNY